MKKIIFLPSTLTVCVALDSIQQLGGQLVDLYFPPAGL